MQGFGLPQNQFTIRFLVFTFQSTGYASCRIFLKSLVKLYGKHIVYSDDGSWYLEACNSLELKHILHTPFEKSIIERAMKSVKDRTECFDDYYHPCLRKGDCNLSHVYQWIILFVYLYNRSGFTFTKIDKWLRNG
jgi:transposase-like protein